MSSSVLKQPYVHSTRSSCCDNGAEFGVDITAPDFDATVAMIDWSHMAFDDEEKAYANDFLQQIMPRVDFERVIGGTEHPYPEDWSHAIGSMRKTGKAISEESLGRVEIRVPERYQLFALGACDPTYGKVILEAAIAAGRLPLGTDPVVAIEADGTRLGLIEMCALAQRAYAPMMLPFVKLLALGPEALQTTIFRAEARFSAGTATVQSSGSFPNLVDTRLVQVATTLASLSAQGVAPTPELWNGVLSSLHDEPADASRDSLLHLLMARDINEAEPGHKGCYEELIDAGFSFDCALHYASAEADLGTVQMLLSRGADPFSKDSLDLLPIDVIPQVRGDHGPRGMASKRAFTELSKLLQAAMARQAAMNAVAEIGRPAAADSDDRSTAPQAARPRG